MRTPAGVASGGCSCSDSTNYSDFFSQVQVSHLQQVHVLQAHCSHLQHAHIAGLSAGRALQHPSPAMAGIAPITNRARTGTASVFNIVFMIISFVVERLPKTGRQKPDCSASAVQRRRLAAFKRAGQSEAAWAAPRNAQAASVLQDRGYTAGSNPVRSQRGPREGDRTKRGRARHMHTDRLPAWNNNRNTLRQAGRRNDHRPCTPSRCPMLDDSRPQRSISRSHGALL